ncbi:MAG: BrnA antitoxin family protein [Acidobacteria bacterium]|nr:BrnA antitoxin family protein [Acidobacteriota bacterium]
MSRRKGATRRSIPRFVSEDAERRFWAEHDTTEYFDWSQAVEASFPRLKPSTTAISLRLPVTMLEGLKALANAKGVPISRCQGFLGGSAGSGARTPGAA